MLEIKIYGARGSTPCSAPSLQRYGGNTSCVLVSVPGEQPIICDLGTGLRQLGLDLLAGGNNTFRGTALLSHLHWDHIQGVPFFVPVLRPGAELAVYGPAQEGRTMAEIVDQFIAPPLFPVSLADLPGTFSFTEVAEESFPVGSATITAFGVEHVGPMNGYRIDHESGSVAYISDCQEPLDGSGRMMDSVVRACRGVDVLIHDAQYSLEELEARRDWGHCTADYAYSVAREVQAARLVLFHHDPTHDDVWIAAEVDRLNRKAAADGAQLEVLAAGEGMVLRSGDT